MRKKKTYAFKEIEQYHEYLETKHLRSKNQIVSGVFFVLFILNLTYMIFAKYPMETVIQVSIGYLALLLANFILYAYSNEDNSYLKINKYVSTLGMFSLATILIVVNRSPSFIPLLFVAYCICAIYQDIKVMIVSNIYFMVAIILTIVSFP